MWSLRRAGRSCRYSAVSAVCRGAAVPPDVEVAIPGLAAEQGVDNSPPQAAACRAFSLFWTTCSRLKEVVWCFGLFQCWREARGRETAAGRRTEQQRRREKKDKQIKGEKFDVKTRKFQAPTTTSAARLRKNPKRDHDHAPPRLPQPPQRHLFHDDSRHPGEKPAHVLRGHAEDAAPDDAWQRIRPEREHEQR